MRPHFPSVVQCQSPTAHITAKVDKVNDLALILLIGEFCPSRLRLLSENIFSKPFAPCLLLTHSHPFNENCFSSTVNLIAATTLLTSAVEKNNI